MKKALCLLLCVLLCAALFAGCAGSNNPDTTTAPVETLNAPTDTAPATTEEAELGINYKGLVSRDITPETLSAAEERDMDAETTVDENPMYIFNNVSYLDLTFFQLQCIIYSDKTTVTLTYTLGEGETVETAMQTVAGKVDADFGSHTVSDSSSGMQIFTWREAAVNDNYICMYPNGTTELKLCFYLY